MIRHALRIALLVVVCAAALELVFALRIATMAFVDPRSTCYQRSEAWRLLQAPGRFDWSQRWVDAAQISDHLKRAVIASEDAGFVDHPGFDRAAIEQAWERNRRALARAERLQQRDPDREVALRLVGGSTITQQLAKNLFLSGERSIARKAQELVLALLLETLLTKGRILEIYLNSVEWGNGVFGAEAAARRYFHVDAARLGVAQAARLAVMLPAPKRFETQPASPYVASRAATIAARMGAVRLP